MRVPTREQRPGSSAAAGAARWVAVGASALFLGLGGLGAAGSDTEPVPTIVLALVAFAGAAVASLRSGAATVLAAGAFSIAAFAVLGTGTSANVGWFIACVLGAWFALALGAAPALGYLIVIELLFGGEWLWASHDPGWGAWAAGTLFSVAAGMSVRRQSELVAALRTASAGLADRARAEERNRIARDLHDVIAHTLTVSLLHVTSARLAVEEEPEEAAAALAEAEARCRDSLAEVRAVVGLLRPDPSPAVPSEIVPGPAGLVPPPGLAGLADLVERFRGTGADISLVVDADSGTVPATVGVVIYRIAQEALTNAVKHAAGAACVVRVSPAGQGVRLEVDSAGAAGSGAGVGVPSMRERADAVGGTCTAGPGGTGWLVRADLPLTPNRVAP